jgi:non-ribosomal peptide synthetase component F/aryl carrier-like protein
MYCQVPNTARPSQIGTSFPHCSLYVIKDETIQPRGAIGELCIGGAHVARGYCNRPELTEKSFLIGYAGIEERIYRTGDLCRMLQDGSIEFLGRNDDQVKLRGLRIQLSEIETTLKNLSETVQDSVSLVLNHPTIGMDQIVTFVVPKQTSVNTNEVIRLCSSHLAPYMVPSHVVEISQIPLTVSGKCDRIMLKKLFHDLKLEDKVIDFEPTRYQEIFKDTIARCLQIPTDEISWGRSLIAYGIDSISSAVLASQLRKEGYSVTSLDIMKANSMKDLVESIENASSDTNLLEKVTENLKTFRTLQDEIMRNQSFPSPIKRLLPATPLQAGMVSITLTSEIPMYYNFTILRLENQTNVDRLVESFRQVILNNDIYQTGFIHSSQSEYPLVQVVYDGYLDSIQNHQNPIVSLEEFKAIEQQWILEEPLRSLNLPPIRLDTFKTESENYLLFAIHHSLYDGWSLINFFKQVAMYYEEQILQDNPQYDSFVAYIYSKEPEKERDFWKTLFQHTEIVEFPTLKISDSQLNTVHRLNRTSKISKHLLEAKCREWNVTPQAVVQAGWINVLSGILGTFNVTFGQVWSGRNIPMDGALTTLGPLFNTIPFTYTKKKSMNDVEMIGEIHQLNLELLNRCFTPLRDILKWTERSSLFDSIFLFQSGMIDDQGEKLPWNVVDGNLRLDFPLAMSVVLSESLQFEASCQSTRMDFSHLELLVDQLEDQVCKMIGLENTEPPLSQHPSQSMAIHNSQWIHEYVGHWSNYNPNHVAIEFLLSVEGETETISYRDLETLSNQVGHYLVKEKIERDNIVMISMERSIFLYAILLGILKSGGAYCYLDPKLPESRKLYMIENSESKMILCSEETSVLIPDRFKEKVRTLMSHDVKEYATTKPEVVIQSCDLAYVIYTSGSTGVPKGVMVEHGNVQSCMNGFDKLIPLDQHHRFLQFASLAFDVSVFEIFYSFMKGAHLVTASQETILGNVVEVINRLQVTHMDLTPTVCSLISSRDMVPTVEILVSGGEGITQKV